MSNGRGKFDLAEKFLGELAKPSAEKAALIASAPKLLPQLQEAAKSAEATVGQFAKFIESCRQILQDINNSNGEFSRKCSRLNLPENESDNDDVLCGTVREINKLFFAIFELFRCSGMQPQEQSNPKKSDELKEKLDRVEQAHASFVKAHRAHLRLKELNRRGQCQHCGGLFHFKLCGTHQAERHNLLEIIAAQVEATLDCFDPIGDTGRLAVSNLHRELHMEMLSCSPPEIDVSSLTEESYRAVIRALNEGIIVAKREEQAQRQEARRIAAEENDKIQMRMRDEVPGMRIEVARLLQICIERALARLDELTIIQTDSQNALKAILVAIGKA